MKRTAIIGAGLAMSLAAAPAIAADQGQGRGGPPSRCNLQSLGNQIQHVVHLQFDNVHLARDNPNVPSDLEQMPNLLNFLKGEGTLFTNHHTPLISHTAVNILTTLTGTYGDKFGVPIGNSFGIFQNGVASFQSSFAYWTDPALNGVPVMVDQRGKVHPAPWVPFTQAGCDVGGFSTANIEFENITSDINNVFGANSPQAAEAKANPAKAVADFEGIAVHCAQNSPLCANNAGPDILKDEPGGYIGFTALYGNANVQPQISPGGPVKDLDGNVISDSKGNPGFPGFDPTASQTLGYVATLLEAGVPVVYAYISDAHDNHGQSISGVDPSVARTFGPGERGYVRQLAAYNDAFGKFFARLAKDGITKENTLFIVTADENDHFVGGPPSPPNCDGVEVPCSYAKIGEVDGNLTKVLFTEFNEVMLFRVHGDSAPTFYIQGNPGQTDPVTRRFEQEAGKAQGFDPVDFSQGPNGSSNQLAQALAGQAEQDLLHMITSDPARTPNFILFANPDYFLFASGAPTLCNTAVPSDFKSCFTEEGPKGFAWNHGDFQEDITKTWLGMVGPGVVAQDPIDDSVFSDHTDIRPTMLRLVGLTDDYAHDGRVLFEALNHDAAGGSLRAHRDMLSALAAAYKAINAPLGTLGLKTLTGISTTALKADDATYAMLTAQIKNITAKRNQIAGQMIAMLEDAAFAHRPIDEAVAANLIKQAQDLLQSVP